MPSVIQIHAKIGAKMMISSALTDWNQLDGKVRPKTLLRVLLAANRFRLVAACSNADQKMEAPTKSTTMTISRFCSSFVQVFPAKSQTKNATTSTRYTHLKASVIASALSTPCRTISVSTAMSARRPRNPPPS